MKMSFPRAVLLFFFCKLTDLHKTSVIKDKLHQLNKARMSISGVRNSWFAKEELRILHLCFVWDKKKYRTSKL